MMLNATNKNTLTAIVIVFCLLSLIMSLSTVQTKRSTYKPRPITIETKEPSSIFDLPYSVDCTPGYPQSAYYTKSLTPGGICDDQKWVKQQADAVIVDGIGGSLI